jgi:hypothetical protein
LLRRREPTVGTIARTRHRSFDTRAALATALASPPATDPFGRAWKRKDHECRRHVLDLIGASQKHVTATRAGTGESARFSGATRSSDYTRVRGRGRRRLAAAHGHAAPSCGFAGARNDEPTAGREWTHGPHDEALAPWLNRRQVERTLKRSRAGLWHLARKRPAVAARALRLTARLDVRNRRVVLRAVP